MQFVVAIVVASLLLLRNLHRGNPIISLAHGDILRTQLKKEEEGFCCCWQLNSYQQGANQTRVGGREKVGIRQQLKQTHFVPLLLTPMATLHLINLSLSLSEQELTTTTPLFSTKRSFAIVKLSSSSLLHAQCSLFHHQSFKPFEIELLRGGVHSQTSLRSYR